MIPLTLLEGPFVSFGVPSISESPSPPPPHTPGWRALRGTRDRGQRGAIRGPLQYNEDGVVGGTGDDHLAHGLGAGVCFGTYQRGRGWGSHW